MIQPRNQKQLVQVLYSLISFSFFMVFIDAAGIFHPIPDIIAAVTLLIASFYIGKYGQKNV